MAQEIRAFTVTTPAGTTQAAPLVTNIAMPPRIVREVEIRVPPGPYGNMGFALGLAGVPIIPYNAGQFIVTDNEIITWPLGEDYPNSGAWQVISFNTGRYPHSIQLRFMLDLVTNKITVPVIVPNIVGLSSSGPAPVDPTLIGLGP